MIRIILMLSAWISWMVFNFENRWNLLIGWIAFILIVIVCTAIWERINE